MVVLMSASPVIMIMGPPGSGKGTQALELHQRYGFEQIETGAIFRQISTEASAEGRELKARMNAGRFASPLFAARLVIGEAERLLKRGKGIVFDGSPRTLHEAELLLAALRRKRAARILVIFLEVLEQETVRRIVNRWACEGCEHLSPGAAESPEACAACGGKLMRRADDTVEVAKERWEEYTFRTLPVIQYFERQGFVVRVDGNQSLQDVSVETKQRVAEFFGFPPTRPPSSGRAGTRFPPTRPPSGGTKLGTRLSR